MPYDEPLRLRVLKALTTCLQGITITNGYKHDLADSVFRGRVTYGESDPMPLVTILEEPLPEDALASPGSKQYANEWRLVIQGFVLDDPINPTDPAYYLEADVRKALAAERQRKRPGGGGIFGMDGIVDDIVISSPAVRPADEISATAYFWLRVNLKVVEDLLDPYG